MKSSTHTGQLVYFFDEPTIYYCVMHETSAFRYDPQRGIQCSEPGCTESMWIGFECTSLALHDAQEAVDAANANRR